MKILATLIIFGLCANVCLSGNAPVLSAASISANALNSTPVRVYTAANATDAAVWNPNTANAASTQISNAYVYFGPGATNTTSYVWAVIPDTGNKLKSVIRRSLNAALIAPGNDTTSESYVLKADDTIACAAPQTNSAGFMTAVAPNYFAILSAGTDGTNQQVYVNLVTGTTATQTKITATADVTGTAANNGKYCTTTVLTPGNIWYDIGSNAFFFTYVKSVATDASAISGGNCGGSPATVYTIGLGGIYLNGTVFWTAPLSLTTTTPANQPTAVMGGSDNWLNSTNLYVVYKDGSATPPTTYVAKTAKTATAGGSFSTLVADVTGNANTIGKTFAPAGVWCSNFTYGIAVTNKTQTAAGAATYTYMVGNYLNGTTTYTDSGLTFSSATALGGVWGWPLTTGYTQLVQFTATSAVNYVYGAFYANGTANGTQVSLGTAAGAVSVYEDTNGTMWFGYQDVDSANAGLTYAGWLAKLQGQINVAGSSANALTTILTFVALLLASIFVF
jgi:hypothetical protein